MAFSFTIEEYHKASGSQQEEWTKDLTDEQIEQLNEEYDTYLRTKDADNKRLSNECVVTGRYCDKILSYEELLELKNKGEEPAKIEWEAAWFVKQQKEASAPKVADPNVPAPLLANKIAAEPPGSNQRIATENLKSTIDGSASNNGSGLDALTRESYKDTKRLVKSSEKLAAETAQPLPDAGSIVGEEEGKIVNNLQSHTPALTNAIKPVSDAIGSHADTASSIVKDTTGPAQTLPQAANSLVSSISKNTADNIDGVTKAIKLDEMQHMCSKMMGSVRNLATAADAVLAVPFEIASDVYGGLLEIMDEISNLVDSVMAFITDFAISTIGGLMDSLIPPKLLESVVNPIMSIAGEIGDIGQLLGGFPAISNIANGISGIAGSLASALSDPAKLAAALAGGADIAGIIGGLAGQSAGCASNQLKSGAGTVAAVAGGITGALQGGISGAVQGATSAIGGVLGGLPNMPDIGKGFGNLGAVLAGGGGISDQIGKLTSNLRNPGQLISGILPPEISQVMGVLDQVPGLGMVGNPGFSIGSAFDSLTDNSFSKCMKQYAAHAGIVSPLFNKQHDTKGGYSQEESAPQGSFEEMPFGNGAQGNKGITMLGPGATALQRMFPGGYASTINSSDPVTQAAFDAEVDAEVNRIMSSPPRPQAEIQAEIAQLQAERDEWFAKAAAAGAAANS